jgi:ABC-type phosphate transport system substrate-binding protein
MRIATGCAIWLAVMTGAALAQDDANASREPPAAASADCAEKRALRLAGSTSSTAEVIAAAALAYCEKEMPSQDGVGVGQRPLRPQDQVLLDRLTATVKDWRSRHPQP